jgi:uncharacterized membrane protein
MKENSKRLYFIDAMRAWAILMMLQGHFIDGLLDTTFRDPSNLWFTTWKYFRGITAPVFFTVSGFIFTYLLLNAPVQGSDNPRLRKGLKRGLQLIGIGYLLRIDVFGLFKGVIYPNFYLVDVLHCIGVALLVLIGIYTAVHRAKSSHLSITFLVFGVLLFLFEPLYKIWDFSFMPQALANYFTKENGSVFTIIPWVGYAIMGGSIATVFYKNRDAKNLYLKSIGLFLLGGVSLVWLSSPLFAWFGEQTGISLFAQIATNNYLFIRLGDVFFVFAVFILLRGLMKRKFFLSIGQHTLSIYVIHFIILYGSFTGVGLYRYWYHQLSPAAAISGAILFMGLCTWAALVYNRRKADIFSTLSKAPGQLIAQVSPLIMRAVRIGRLNWLRLTRYLSAAQERS